ncbi:MAG: 4'-phosphopantetheinyl transferase family protein [Anaerovoracaceae bacterium]
MYIYLCKWNRERTSEELVRQFLTDYVIDKNLNFSEKEILRTPIGRGPYGKPYFHGLENIHFSISHSGDYWGCVFEEVNIGFDLEDLSRRMNGNNPLTFERQKAIAKRFFTTKEYEYISTVGKASFLKIWVRKEAYLKYKGIGIASGLSRFNLIEKNRIVNQPEENIYIEEIDTEPIFIAAYCAPKKLEVEKVAYIGLEKYERHDINGRKE